MREKIEKTQKIPENQARNHVAVEMRVNWANMCFRGSPEMTQEAPKASRERPRSTPEHARNVPGVSLERPKRIPGALQHPLERSKGVLERLGDDLGRKMTSLKSIFEAVADASWLFQAMFRFCVHRFSNAIELTRIVNMPKKFCSISF